MNIFPSPHQSLNPFPFYAQMRKFHPIEYDEKNKVWGIFRYKDIQTILTDYRNFSSNIQKLVSIQQEQEIQKSRELRDHKKKDDYYEAVFLHLIHHVIVNYEELF